ncbi:ArsR/SmtB family transcription factor [Planomonospora corallina]|uniref:ArsR/SmtB family transcription factor n=1 Tax=Planomonospora corallina TaxID=1806052 RepID=A0ABV8I3G2_9ACTN
MTEDRRPLSDTELSDPRAMRALAHPARLAILNRLRTDGAATATEVAEVVGVTPSAASYHLRMLAKYGFVEDAPARGDGRERLWRRAVGGWSVTPQADDPPGVREAKDTLIKVVREEAAAEVTRALRNLDREPPEWQEASIFMRSVLLVEAGEMKRLVERIEELLAPYLVEQRRKEGAPEGARVSEAQISLFPRAERRPHGLPSDG